MRIFLMIFILSVDIFSWSLFGLGTQTKETEVEVRTVLPMDIEYEKVAARSHLNSIREAMGLNTLIQNDLLNIAAQAHADYLVANEESSHYEIEGHQKFIGIKPVDRTLSANYASMHVSENLSTHTYNAQNSINGLFSAIYHRFGFLSQSIDEIGVGTAQDKSKTANSAFVYVMGNSYLERLCHEENFSGTGKYYYKICKNETHRIGEKAFKQAQVNNKRYNPKIIVYPYDEEDDIPPAFYDESPDPLPLYDVSGFPVSIEFNDYYFKKVELLNFKLFDNTDTEITDILIMDKENDPNQRFTDKQFALFPLKRLSYHAQYRAEVRYRVENKVQTLSWVFNTQKPTEELHTIKTKDATVHLSKGKSHILYLVPQNAHDMLKNIQFPTSVDIVFIDHNTLKLTVMDENLDNFEIKTKERVIHVIVD